MRPTISSCRCYADIGSKCPWTRRIPLASHTLLLSRSLTCPSVLRLEVLSSCAVCAQLDDDVYPSDALLSAMAAAVASEAHTHGQGFYGLYGPEQRSCTAAGYGFAEGPGDGNYNIVLTSVAAMRLELAKRFAAAFYSSYAPLVNATRGNGEDMCVASRVLRTSPPTTPLSALRSAQLSGPPPAPTL